MAARTITGQFDLPGHGSVVGELTLDGSDTKLRLLSRSPLPLLRCADVIHGTSFDGKQITCIDCVVSSQTTGTKREVVTHASIDMFPHFVVTGDAPFNPSEPCVSKVGFTTADMTSLFYDFDAFGFVICTDGLIDSILAERRKLSSFEVGDRPQIACFSGKSEIVVVDTVFGKFRASHRPTSNMGGPDGVTIGNRIFVTLEPRSATAFKGAIDGIASVARFLSVVAGRQQPLRHLEIAIRGADSDQLLHDVYWSFGEEESASEQPKPHPSDVPVDPIRRPEEFTAVATDWIARDTDWGTARSRYLRCVADGNRYDVDRLVAAANMFDVLPKAAVPLVKELPEDLAGFRIRALEELREFQRNPDRDSLISAIARIGSPSLPRKVMHRAGIVMGKAQGMFPDLEVALRTAIQCRNHFVHGPSDKFDFDKIEPFVPFCTEALEFVFAASDLIEAGWDMTRWLQDGHGSGHSFARFQWDYKEMIKGLVRATRADA